MAQLGPLAQGFSQGCNQGVGQNLSHLEPYLGEDLVLNSRGYIAGLQSRTFKLIKGLLVVYVAKSKQGVQEGESEKWKSQSFVLV